MFKFHVLFKLEKDKFTSKGESFDAIDAFTVLLDFYKKYPKAIFLGMYSLDNISELMRSGHQITATTVEDHKEATRLEEE